MNGLKKLRESAGLRGMEMQVLEEAQCKSAIGGKKLYLNGKKPERVALEFPPFLGRLLMHNIQINWDMLPIEINPVTY